MTNEIGQSTSSLAISAETWLFLKFRAKSQNYWKKKNTHTARLSHENVRLLASNLCKGTAHTDPRSVRSHDFQIN